MATCLGRPAFSLSLLIGGDGWASELTAAEGGGLRQALQTLQGQYDALQDTLMEEETLCLEFQCRCPSDLEGGPEGNLWVSLEGDRRNWVLRLVLEPAGGLRGLEGSWDSGAARAFLEAFTQLEFLP